MNKFIHTLYLKKKYLFNYIMKYNRIKRVKLSINRFKFKAINTIKNRVVKIKNIDVVVLYGYSFNPLFIVISNIIISIMTRQSIGHCSLSDEDGNIQFPEWLKKLSGSMVNEPSVVDINNENKTVADHIPSSIKKTAGFMLNEPNINIQEVPTSNRDYSDISKVNSNKANINIIPIKATKDIPTDICTRNIQNTPMSSSIINAEVPMSNNDLPENTQVNSNKAKIDIRKISTVSEELLLNRLKNQYQNKLTLDFIHRELEWFNKLENLSLQEKTYKISKEVYIDIMKTLTDMPGNPNLKEIKEIILDYLNQDHIKYLWLPQNEYDIKDPNHLCNTVLMEYLIKIKQDNTLYEVERDIIRHIATNMEAISIANLQNKTPKEVVSNPEVYKILFRKYKD